METQEFKFAAKLLFQFQVVGSDGASNIMRTCEERIILIHAETSRSALVIAKQRGKSAKHRYKNSNGDDVFLSLLELWIFFTLDSNARKMKFGTASPPESYQWNGRQPSSQRKANLVPYAMAPN